MKSITVLLLCAVLTVALAEPLRYRQGQQIQASARQTDGGVALQAELGDSTTEATAPNNDNGRSDAAPQVPTNQNVPQGYLPQGWRPFGQLLVLPFAVRENLESTTTVESSTLNDAETTEEPSTTTETFATRGQPRVETSEPKVKKTAPYKRPTVKLVGELKVAPKEATKQKPQENSKENSSESNETESTSTETSDEATTKTNAKSENLETTSEPQAEAVDVEESNEEGKQATSNQQPTQVQPQAPQVPQTALFVQLPDGSLQRIVYLPQQTPAQAAFIPQPANVQFQQLNQAPATYPFAINPITNPKIVTFSSQYQAF